MMLSGAISCPLYNLNTLWYFIMIHYNFDEQVLPMCRVQEWQLSLWSSLDAFLKAAISCPVSILNTIRNIFMRLYSSVEEVVIMCHV